MKMTITPDGAMHFEGFEPSQIPDLIKFTNQANPAQPVVQDRVSPTFEIHPQLDLIDDIESPVTVSQPAQLNEHFKEKQVNRKGNSDYHARSKLPIFNNFQYESDDQAKKIDPSYLPAVITSPILRLNFDKDYLLPDSSKQVKGRIAIVSWFFKNNNQSLTREDLVNVIKRDPVTQHINCVATYLNHLRHIGVVAKDTTSGKFHISTWFLTEIQYIPF